MIKEMVGLKCPNHDYIRDNHHFMYKEVYPGARPPDFVTQKTCIL